MADYNNQNKSYYSTPADPITGQLKSVSYKSEDLKRLMEELAQKTEESAAGAVQGASVMDGYENAKRMSAATLNASKAVEAQAMLTKFLHGDGKRAAEGTDGLYYTFGVDSVAKVSMNEQRLFCRQLEVNTELGNGNSVFDGLVDERQKLLDERAKLSSDSSSALKIQDLDKKISEMTSDINNIKKGQQFYREEYSRQVKKQYGVDIAPENIRVVLGTDFTTRGLRKNPSISVYDVSTKTGTRTYNIATSTIETSGYKENGQTFVAKTVAEAAKFSSTEYAAKTTFVENDKKIRDYGKSEWAMRTVGVNNMSGKELSDMMRDKRYKVTLTNEELSDTKEKLHKVLGVDENKENVLTSFSVKKLNGINDPYMQNLLSCMTNESGQMLRDTFTTEELERVACGYAQAERAKAWMAKCSDERERAKIALANGLTGKKQSDLKYKTVGDMRMEMLINWKEGPEKYFNKISSGVRGSVAGLAKDASYNAQDSDVVQGYNVAKKPVQIVRKAINTKWYIQCNYHKIRGMRMQEKIKDAKAAAPNAEKTRKLIEKYQKSYGDNGNWTKRLNRRNERLKRRKAAKDAIFEMPRMVANQTLDATKNFIMSQDKNHTFDGVRKRMSQIKNVPGDIASSKAGRAVRSTAAKGKRAAANKGRKFAKSKFARKSRNIFWGSKTGRREMIREFTKKVGKSAVTMVKHIAVNFMKYVGLAMLFLSMFSVAGIALIGISRINITSVVGSQQWTNIGGDTNTVLKGSLNSASDTLDACNEAIFSSVTDVYDVKRDDFNQTYHRSGGDADLRAENEAYEKKVWNVIAYGYLDGTYLLNNDSKLNASGVYELNRTSNEAALVGGIMSALDTISRIDNVDKSVPFNPFVTQIIATLDAEGNETTQLTVGLAKVRLFDDSMLTDDVIMDDNGNAINEDDIEEAIRLREVKWAKKMNATHFVTIKMVQPNEENGWKESVDINGTVQKDENGNIIRDENGKVVVSDNGGFSVTDYSSREMIVSGIMGFIPLVNMADSYGGGYLSRIAAGQESAAAEDVYNYIIGSEFIKNWYGQETISGTYVDYVSVYGKCEHSNKSDTGKTAEYNPPQVIFRCNDCGEEFTDGTIREIETEESTETENESENNTEKETPVVKPPSSPGKKPGKGFGEIMM